jgi:DNA-binding XRE family transcriptional regulator
MMRRLASRCFSLKGENRECPNSPVEPWKGANAWNCFFSSTRLDVVNLLVYPAANVRTEVAMGFADRLKELRTQAGLTQTALAEASGLPVGSIRNYEQGQREPYWAVVSQLAAALGVSCEAFADSAIRAEPEQQEPRPSKRQSPDTPLKRRGKKK